MSRINFHFQIPIPAFIESIVVYFLLRYRKKHFGCAFRRIKLTKGRYAIVDPEDYQKLAEEDWQFYEVTEQNYYAARLDGGKIVYMHRQIMNAPAGKIVDHRDGEGLNNTKRNLRFATRSQNGCNCPKTSNSVTSKYKGVCKEKNSRKWRARICCNGKNEHLGFFENEEDAARAYDEAAKKYFGEFAVLNFNDNSHQDTKARSKEGGLVLNTLYDKRN
jgi:hypothetical protein